MSFSAEWLALREPIDHAARDEGVLARVIDLLGDNPAPRITDIGSGTGSTIRALKHVLKRPARWHLVDHDTGLLDIAAKEAGHDSVSTHLIDLAATLDPVFDTPCDLITTSAFLDLVSERWLSGFVSVMRDHAKPFYAALTYDGRAGALPPHPQDTFVLNAFNAHQRTEKGFGPALGPDAAETAIRLFAEAGFEVFHALSDWQAGPDHTDFQTMLLDGWRGAAGEIRPDRQSDFDGWFEARRLWLEDAEAHGASVFVGHVDFLATPSG